MKVGEIYRLAIEKGIKSDPRPREIIDKMLAKEKKRFDEMKEDEKKEYDQDRLFNPYSDTRILYGDTAREVKRVLAGIDMETGEILLADRISSLGRKIDLVIGHHPEGKAMSALSEVMKLHEDIMVKFGVPVNVAEGIMASRISEVKRGLMPFNHNRAVDAARLLDIPLMCVHTPADNQVNNYLQKLMDEKQPETLDDVVRVLKQVPEYAEAVNYNAGPAIVIGSKEKRAGKVMVDMTGGTSGSDQSYARLEAAGVGTLVVMHINEKHHKKAKDSHVNVVVAGHIASDSLGLNLILDELVRQGVEIVACAGLLRHERNETNA